MAKCVSCGKIFNYEKYGGICPGCGAYNKRIIEDGSQEGTLDRLRRMYGEPVGDSRRNLPCGSPGNPETAGDIEKAGDLGTPENPGGLVSGADAGERKHASQVSLAVFISILTGLVLAVLIPICYIMLESVRTASYRTLQEGYPGAYGQESYDAYWEDGASEAEDWKVKEIPQNPEQVTLSVGESFAAGVQKQCHIQVNRAFVAAAAGTDLALPTGKNLVAVEISYDSANVEVSQEYDFSDIPYLAYEDNFVQCLGIGEADPYLSMLDARINVLDIGEIQADRNGNGVFLAFVPVGVTDITFSIESRDERTNDIRKIYQIPLEIEPGEDI